MTAGPRRRPLAARLCCLTALLAAILPATSFGATSRSPAATRKAPIVLPGSVAAAAVKRAPGSWIVAGRPGSATRRIAQRFAARPVLGSAGIYKVRIASARPFATALRAAHRLTFAEPNALVRREAFPSDPLTPQQWWLPAVVDGGLTPPPVTPDSPVLAIIESQVDRSHPDLGHVTSTSSDPVTELHATAVAGVASAAANGTGIVGVWPGMRLLDSVGDESCSGTVAAVRRAIERAAVINMSYGFITPGSCFAHQVATNYAFGRGVTLVASAGNGFLDGNPLSDPGVDPHIITAAATDQDNNSASFSNENGGVDVSAPGVNVLTTVPPAYDTDGNPDGYTPLDGTSFSAPIVAAAAAWIIQQRPNLANDQVSGVLRDSAVDLGQPGWDQSYGFGLVNVANALGQSAERHDPNEPNDDIKWIDGTYFSPDAPIFRPGD